MANRDLRLPHQIALVFAGPDKTCIDGSQPAKNDVVVTCNCHLRDAAGHFSEYIGLAPDLRQGWRLFNQPAFHDLEAGRFIPDPRMLMKYGAAQLVDDLMRL